jgi:hypothetical protein
MQKKGTSENLLFAAASKTLAADRMATVFSLWPVDGTCQTGQGG